MLALGHSIRLLRTSEADHVLYATETEAAKETTETPAAETTDVAAKEEAKEEAKKEAEPVEDGQLEHKGSNFPKYVITPLQNKALLG